MCSAFRLSLLISLTVLLSFTTFAAEEHGTEEKKQMGPAAFLWPADRAWDANFDNTAPCGSNAGVVNRTDFPMSMIAFFETDSD
jgi:hypothetical protein